MTCAHRALRAEGRVSAETLRWEHGQGPMWWAWGERGGEGCEVRIDRSPGSWLAHGKKLCWPGIWLMFGRCSGHCWCPAHIPFTSRVYLSLRCWECWLLRLIVAPFSVAGGLSPKGCCVLVPGGSPQPMTLSTPLPEGGTNPMVPFVVQDTLRDQVRASLWLRPQPCLGPSPALSCLLPSPPRESLSQALLPGNRTENNQLSAT